MGRLCFFYFLALFFLIGCSHEKNRITELDNIENLFVPKKIDFDSLISPRQLLKDVEYIKLEEEGEIKLTIASKIKEIDDKLFILDKKKQLLLIYGLNGKFLGYVGKKGEGPGEYHVVSDFDIDNSMKEIYVFSRSNQALYIHNLDGKFVRKIDLKIWGNQISILESGNIALYSYFDDVVGDESGFGISIFDRNGSLVQKCMPHPLVENYAPADYTGFINENFFTYPISSVIYKINEEDKIDLPILKINLPNPWEESKKFNHAEFNLNGSWVKHGILGNFFYNQNNSEVIFYYSFKESGGNGFTLGVRLVNGQIFGHENLRHGSNGKDDVFVNLFFRGPYNLPSYSNSTGFYYVSTNIETIGSVSTDPNSKLNKELYRLDKKLFNILKDMKDKESPIIMKFKLKNEL